MKSITFIAHVGFCPREKFDGRNPTASTDLNLTFQDELPRADDFVGSSWDGFSVECVRHYGARVFEYTWRGNANYLGLHDIALANDEIAIGGAVSVNCTNLRERLTFVAHDLEVRGWSKLAGNDHGCTAFFFNPELAEAGFVRPPLDQSDILRIRSSGIQ